jgi:hypothetical protein
VCVCVFWGFALTFLALQSDPDGYFFGYDEQNNEGYFPGESISDASRAKPQRADFPPSSLSLFYAPGNYTELGADE